MKTNGDPQVFLNMIARLVDGKGNNQILHQTLPQLLRLYDLSSSTGREINIMPVIEKILQKNYPTHWFKKFWKTLGEGIRLLFVKRLKFVTKAELVIHDMKFGSQEANLFNMELLTRRTNEDDTIGPFNLTAEGTVQPPQLNFHCKITLTFRRRLLYWKGHTVTITDKFENLAIAPMVVVVKLLGEINQPMREFKICKLLSYNINKADNAVQSIMADPETSGATVQTFDSNANINVEVEEEESTEDIGNEQWTQAVEEEFKQELREELELLKGLKVENEASADEQTEISDRIREVESDLETESWKSSSHQGFDVHNSRYRWKNKWWVKVMYKVARKMLLDFAATPELKSNKPINFDPPKAIFIPKI